MGSKEDVGFVGDFSRTRITLFDTFSSKGNQTQNNFLEAEVKVVDKGVQARRGRSHNRAYVHHMNNSSQTNVQRHRYSVFVVMFLLLMVLHFWFAYVTLKIHYKVFSPTHIDRPPSRFEWMVIPYRYFKKSNIFKRFFA